jgi:ATP-binding cassette, subfamily B, bacterial
MSATNRWARLWRRPRIPYVAQVTSSDCGSACLAMVLARYGVAVELRELAQSLGPGRDGSSLLAMRDVADAYGLKGRLLRLEPESLSELPAGTILHWEFTHFVVLERAGPHGTDVVDPAVGRRRVSPAELGRSFTGLALAFEEGPSPADRGARRKPKATGPPARALLRHWPLLTHVAGISFLVTLCAMATPLLLTAIIDRVLPHRDHGLLFAAGVGVAAAAGLYFLASLVRGTLLLHLRTQLDLEITRAFVEHLVNLPFAFFQTRSRGDLMLRLNSNSEVREILTAGALSAVLDGSFVLVYVIVLFALSPAIAWLAIALGAAQISILVWSQGPQKRLTSRYLQAQSRVNNHQIELLGGIETLKSMGREDRAVERWSALFVDVLNASLVRGRLTTIVESLLATLRVAAPLCLTWFGAREVVAGRLPLGTMLALVSLSMAFLGPLSTLVTTGLRFSTLASYLDRIADVLETPVERTGGQPVVDLRGSVRLEQVQFRYAPDAAPTLSDVDLEIHPGEFVAIVGPSGAGKSTLARLLAGLLVPCEGRLLYDGTPLGELDLRSLRRHLGIVTQQPQLLGLTVRANIAFADPAASLDHVIAAARAARLHDEILAMPMGYDTLVGDGGMSLSGGQRQRLALARALLGRPALLILDEATSALDAVTEQAIQQELAAMRCTRVVIAHRLSTVLDADLIVVLDNGRIVERGRHRDLLAQERVYRRLVAAQMEGLAPDRARPSSGPRNGAGAVTASSG